MRERMRRGSHLTEFWAKRTSEDWSWLEPEEDMSAAHKGKVGRQFSRRQTRAHTNAQHAYLHTAHARDRQRKRDREKGGEKRDRERKRIGRKRARSADLLLQ